MSKKGNEDHAKYKLLSEMKYVKEIVQQMDNPILEAKIGNLLKWYIRNARRDKCCYYVCNCLIIISNASIPICSLLFKNGSIHIVNCILATVATTFFSLSNLFHLKENWTRYRKSAEELKAVLSEYLLLQSGCSKEDKRMSLCKECEKGELGECVLVQQLVEKVNSIESLENESWYNLYQKEYKKD